MDNKTDVSICYSAFEAIALAIHKKILGDDENFGFTCLYKEKNVVPASISHFEGMYFVSSVLYS